MASECTPMRAPLRVHGLVKLTLGGIGLVLLALALFPLGAGAEKGEFAEFVVFDSDEKHSNAPLPDSESSDYEHFRPAIAWPHSRKPVEFVVSGAPFDEATDAVIRAVNTLDRSVTTRRFVRDDRTRQTNPCTREPSSIRWLPGDGPGKGLAFAGVCYNTKTREIAGFRIMVDSLEGWSTTGEPEKFDVESVLAHEMGHVAGLDHAVGNQNALLTMYPYTAHEETHKRTLGTGDRRGLDALYDDDDDEEAEDEDRERRDRKRNRKGPDYTETGGGNNFWD